MIKDYIIVGAGPAGLQLGHLMQKNNEDYLVLESGSNVGSFFRAYPRHRQLISINKRYTGEVDKERNMRMDWNSLISEDKELKFTDYTGRYFPEAEVYVQYLEDYHQEHNIHIEFNKRVSKIDKQDLFTLHTDDGTIYKCKYLIMATGVSKENIPDIPGIELCERYSETSIDPLDYVNQRVLVLGKGNSAFETADNLVETTAYIHVAGRSSIKLAWQTHYVGHLRAVNNNLLDSYQLKSQNAILDGDVLSIKKVNNEFEVKFSFSRSGEVEKTLRYDRIICCTGFKFDVDVFASHCRPTLTINDRFPKMNSDWQSANVENLYFAGTIMQQRDFKKSTCGFVHGFRYAVRSLFYTLTTKNNGTELPYRELQLNSEIISHYIAERVNRTSALWQQFEFLCDTLVLDHLTGFAHYIEEIPVEYTHETLSKKHDVFMNITLEYGADHDKVDPFNIDIARVEQDDAENALNSQYLHPVIRFYRSGELISTHHMAENLENEWNRQESHILPLQKYLDKSLKFLISKNEMADAV